MGWQALDGNELLDRCTDALRHVDNGYRSTRTEPIFNYAWYVGYMRGWIDGYQSGATLCVPETITALQLVRIVVKYLRDHPQMLHYTRGFLIFTAVQEAFPCAAGADTPATPLLRSLDDIERDLFGTPAPAQPAPATPPPPAPSKKRQR